jgi:hypothetical protein
VLTGKKVMPMTRPEMTGTRDLSMSGWIREKLPLSRTGYRVTDMDFVLEDKDHMIFVEVKTHGCETVRPVQNATLSRINFTMREGESRLSEREGYMPKYMGQYYLFLSDTDPDNSDTIKLCSVEDYENQKPPKTITKERLRQFFSFEIQYDDI